MLNGNLSVKGLWVSLMLYLIYFDNMFVQVFEPLKLTKPIGNFFWTKKSETKM